MSHTTTIKKFAFIHDGDYEGTIEIVNLKSGERFEIPADELLEFFGRYFVHRKKCVMDDLTGRQYLERVAKTCG